MLGETVDYYDLFGILPCASPEQIEAAWRTYAKTHHPDLSAGSGEKDQLMKAANAAREVLLDPGRRREHDNALGILTANSPRTMTEARSQIAKARMDVVSLRAEVQTLRTRRTDKSDHQSCIRERDRAIRAALNRQMDDIAAQVNPQFESANRRIAEQDNQIRNLVQERDAALAVAQSRSSTSRTVGSVPHSRWLLWVLWLVVTLVCLAQLALDTWGVATSARDFAPMAADWPNWLRQAPVPALAPMAAMLGLLALLMIPLRSQSLTIIVGPALAIAGICALKAVPLDSLLWSGGAGQIANCLSTYLLAAASVWTARVTTPG